MCQTAPRVLRKLISLHGIVIDLIPEAWSWSLRPEGLDSEQTAKHVVLLGQRPLELLVCYQIFCGSYKLKWIACMLRHVVWLSDDFKEIKFLNICRRHRRAAICGNCKARYPRLIIDPNLSTYSSGEIDRSARTTVGAPLSFLREAPSCKQSMSEKKHDGCTGWYESYDILYIMYDRQATKFPGPKSLLNQIANIGPP